MVEIREATDGDIEQIIMIHNRVFPELATTVEQATAVFQTNTHRPYVATVDGVIAGFVDGFATPSEAGAVWNVDLLAVDPRFQGRQLGRKLITANVAAGQAVTSRIRALIRTDNSASQRAFTACGFYVETAVCTLMVKLLENIPETVALTPPASVRLIPVTTLDYSGVWLETVQSEPTIDVVTLSINAPLVGAVIPNHEAAYLRSAKTAVFEPVGEYQWWWLK